VVKNRMDQWLTVTLFCGFLGIMALLYLVLPRQSYSSLEKRYLEKTPQLSAEALTSGEFGQDVDAYMADHIPGRSFFVGLNAYTQLYTGRQVAEDIYVAAGDRLVEAPVDADMTQAEKNMYFVNLFAQSTGAQVDLMIVPSAGWAAQNEIKGVHFPYKDTAYISAIGDLCGENVNPVQLQAVYEDRPELYYRTDHHWTSRGAYEGCKAYLDYKNRDYPRADEFTVTTVRGFTGSTYSRAGLWLIAGEPLEMWSRTQGLQVTNETGNIHDGVFYVNRLEETDMYTVFLDGNHGMVTIHNPQGKGSILVIRDSYSNCLGGFLAESYETVVLVDMRYYMGEAVSQLYSREGFDDVLVCYSLGNFMTDNNLFKLQ